MADVRPPNRPADAGESGDGAGPTRWGRRGGSHPHPRARTRGTRPDSRGQLLLVTSLAIAVLLVSLALLLNTAIYTENLATRSADPGSADAISYQRDVVQGVGGAVTYANTHHAQNESALADALTASVVVWDDATARHAAVDADAAGVRVASSNGTPAITYGRQVVQNRTRNFTAANGAANWTLTTDVAPNRGLRAFRLSVRPGNLSSAPNGSFRVDVTDADQTWRVHVYGNASAVQVAVYDDTTGSLTTDANCSAAPTPTDGTVTVDLTAGTVGGRECAPLSVFADVDDAFDVAYRNADAIDGTYSVVVNRSTLGADAGVYATQTSGSVPYTAPAVYAVAADVAFTSQRVTYATTVRVAPGEAADA